MKIADTGPNAPTVAVGAQRASNARTRAKRVVGVVVVTTSSCSVAVVLITLAGSKLSFEESWSWYDVAPAMGVHWMMNSTPLEICPGAETTGDASGAQAAGVGM